MSKFLQIPKSWEKNIDGTINATVQAMKEESMAKFIDTGYKYINRHKKISPKKDNVIRVLGFPEYTPRGKLDLIKEFAYSHNLVTDDGEIYYAIQGAGETPAADEDFSDAGAGFEIGTDAVTETEADTYTQFSAPGGNPITGSNKVYTTGYPKTNDTGDADNTGDGVDVVSYSVDYTTGDFNDNDIVLGCIFDDLASPSAGAKLVSHFSFTSFAKTASDTLKIFVNHAFENV